MSALDRQDMPGTPVGLLEYYCRQASNQMDYMDGEEFWSSLVLRLAPYEPAIQHAISAISMLHASRTMSGLDQPANRRTALFQYNSAIAAVKNWKPDLESKLMPLLVCVLFVCIEFLLGQQYTGIVQMHIVQGRKLLSTVEESTSPELDIIRNHLAPILGRLAYVCILTPGERSSIPDHLVRRSARRMKFSNVNECRDELHHILDQFFLFTSVLTRFLTTERTPSENNSEEEWVSFRSTQRRLITEATSWKNKFDPMIATVTADKVTSRTISLMKVHYHVLDMYLRGIIDSSEYDFDKIFISGAMAATRAAREVVNYDLEHFKGPSFTFESEVIAPLQFIATKFRHPILRREAIKLFCARFECQRIENRWSMRHAIAVAARTIEIEEDGLDTPASAQDKDFPSPQVVSQNRVSNGYLAQKALRKLSGQWPFFWSIGSEDFARITALREDMLSEQERREVKHMNVGDWPQERLEWPFGVPHHARVRNLMVEGLAPGGIYIRYIQGPLPGTSEYRMTREHILLPPDEMLRAYSAKSGDYFH